MNAAGYLCIAGVVLMLASWGVGVWVGGKIDRLGPLVSHPPRWMTVLYGATSVGLLLGVGLLVTGCAHYLDEIGWGEYR